MKKASLIRTLWIMLSSSAYTVLTCLRAIWLSFRGKLDRDTVNYYMRLYSQTMIDAVRLTYKVYNPHNVQLLPNKRYMYMLNHSSLYDIPLTILALPGTMRMIAKKELSKIPLFGRTLTLTEHVFIDRKNRQQAIKDLQVAKERMDSGIVIWVAPEGTRSRTGELGKFKKGGFITAIQAQATIIPVGIRGANKVLPAKTWHFHLNEEAEIHIGEPIDAAEYTLENKEALIQIVESQIRELAGL